MKPTPAAQDAFLAMKRMNTLATIRLEQAIDELCDGRNNAAIAITHTKAALNFLNKLSAAQDVINTMCKSGRA